MDATNPALMDMLNTTDPADLVAPASGSKPAKLAKGGTNSTAAHAAADALGIIREWGKVFDLAATDCCVCGTALRDAVSVTRGIGPVCSRKHYEIDFTTLTVAMVEDALGILHASGLDKPVKLAAKALKAKPRDLCNVLVWWASAHLDETDVVLDCAAVVTALGFESLGDRLRERNTNVIISSVPDSTDFIVRCRAKSNVRRNMRSVKEATPVEREGRFKYGWRFPATRKGLVWTILGEDFGGQWATVPADKASKVVKVDNATAWDVRKAFKAAYPPKTSRAAAPKPLIVRPGKLAGTVEAFTPYRDFAFTSAFKAAVPWNRDPLKGRTWDRDRECWTAPARYEAQVRKLVAEHFNGRK